MKKSYIFLACTAFLFQAGCTKNFDEINTKPTATSAELFDAAKLLPTAQWGYANTGYTRLIFQSMWSQSLASTFDYYSNGDKYVRSTNTTDYQNNLWNDQYINASRVFEMQGLIKDKDQFSNLYQMGTIMKVLILEQITDTYGDVPYSQALQAKAGIIQPVYDKQQAIYISMLTELDAAITKLDASKPLVTTDVYYNGNIAQWKKFGYAIMLRMAMRLTKVDPATAKTWAEKAAAGGTFVNITDNARIKGDETNSFSNSASNALRTASDYLYVKWSKPFIDYLKSTNDPRLSAIAEVPQAGLINNANQDLAGDNAAANQIGLPNGRDLGTGATSISAHPNYPGPSGTGSDAAVLGKYSRPKTAVYLNRSGLNMVLTYAQTELLLAEAKVRGWNVGATSAAVHYKNGVEAAMLSLAQFNAAATVSATDAAAFTALNPLDVTSTENSLRQINIQYWVATSSFFDFIETWTNWRRSGYPVLTPINYLGNFSNGTIPRRIPYQALESANNPSNYAAAVAGISGGDVFNARVWWDKQ